jgi:predicted pyridoxine 5'-phosphate oxidase superfamily flavin-nucleotide-binding protein
MAEQITITVNDDGSFTVAEQEDDASSSDQPINKTVGTVAEVMQLLQQALGDDKAPDPAKAMWDEEAAKRAPTAAEQPPM